MVLFSSVRLKVSALVMFGLFMGSNTPPLSAQPVKVTGLEHVGFNVPNMMQAVRFFRDTFGFEPLTDLGPYPLSDDFKRRYRAHPSATLPHLVMLRAGDGPNIELLEYNSPDASKEQPHFDDLGATHLAFYTDDIAGTLAALHARHVEVLSDPVVNITGPTAGETWFYIRTPWGSLIEFDSYPNGEAFEKHPGTQLLWHPHRVRAEAQQGQ